jgi:hypothetical protein
MDSVTSPPFPTEEVSTVEPAENTVTVRPRKANKLRRVSYLGEDDNDYESMEENTHDEDRTWCGWCQETMNDEDFQQKMSMCITMIVELYRVIMSTLLLMFVPQMCGDNQCSVEDKLYTNNEYEVAVMLLNFYTLIMFTVLYSIESTRETVLINYLDVNKFKPRNNNAVSQEIKRLSPERMDRIRFYDKSYKYVGYISIGSFTVNVAISTVSIFQNYMDSKTLTVLLTNVMFMATKLYDVYSIANTKDFIFLSAYMTRKIQFNDVDKDKVESSVGSVVSGPSSITSSSSSSSPSSSVDDSSFEAETKHSTSISVTVDSNDTTVKA